MPIINGLGILRLRKCSKSAGEPLYAQAGIVGIDPGQYSRIIRGIQIPSEFQAQKIANYFGESVDFFWPATFSPSDVWKELSGEGGEQN